jgi:hypothetical protein
VQVLGVFSRAPGPRCALGPGLCVIRVLPSTFILLAILSNICIIALFIAGCTRPVQSEDYTANTLRITTPKISTLYPLYPPLCAPRASATANLLSYKGIRAYHVPLMARAIFPDDLRQLVQGMARSDTTPAFPRTLGRLTTRKCSNCCCWPHCYSWRCSLDSTRDIARIAAGCAPTTTHRSLYE